ncbi:hypothetical protein DPMN_144569 [Dreissena polymorpha]|uniref:Uncharacterized protein n=1 Tax=Dreissena polymorpha TaxID=45954 RepID=A0A9D4GIF1_DREPO|nr:hypothetical protein DPMN_144569 [Dreissena polymorpha]
MITPRIMKLHRYIDHYWQMTLIDFQVISWLVSEVKAYLNAPDVIFWEEPVLGVLGGDLKKKKFFWCLPIRHQVLVWGSNP